MTLKQFGKRFFDIVLNSLLTFIVLFLVARSTNILQGKEIQQQQLNSIENKADKTEVVSMVNESTKESKEYTDAKFVEHQQQHTTEYKYIKDQLDIIVKWIEKIDK